MQGGWHDFDYWRERQRELLREAEAQRLARTGRPSRPERLGKYRPLLSSVADTIKGLGRLLVSSPRVFPPDEEVVQSGARSVLVDAVFEIKVSQLFMRSVYEFLV